MFLIEAVVVGGEFLLLQVVSAMDKQRNFSFMVVCLFVLHS
jgi:hypothetical protein